MLWIWVAVMFIFLIVEMILGELTALALAIGTLGAILATVLQLAWPFQLMALGAGSALSLVFLRPILRKMILPPTTELTTDAFVGQTAEALEDIPEGERGRVKIHGETWFARSDFVVKTGQRVVITKIQDTVLEVLPQEQLRISRPLAADIQPKLNQGE